MIALARRRHIGTNKVTFITGNAQEVTAVHNYDVVITPFLFDNFTEDGAQQLFTAINGQLSPQALWLYCDFNNTDKLSHRLLLKMMYTFFRLCCGIPATHMPAMAGHFHRSGYEVVTQKDFMNGFITSVVYKKDEHLATLAH